MTTGSRASTVARLGGRSLMVARFVWLTLFAFATLVMLIALPARWAELTHPGPNTLANLLALGLPVSLYAVFSLAIEVIFAVVYLLVGLLIFIRRSDDRMALFVALTLVTFSVGNQTITSSISALRQYSWGEAIYAFSGFAAWITFTQFPYLFPSGRYVPGWSRIPALAWFLFTILWNFMVDSPLYPPTWPPVIFVPLFVFLWGSFAFSQIYRYRRVSTPVERQQTKWVMYALVMIVAFLILSAMVSSFYVYNFIAIYSFEELTTPQFFVFGLVSRFWASIAFLLLPTAFAFSILRYRLWDIDFVLNRSLVYGTLTLLLGAIFFGFIFVLQAIFQSLLGAQQTTLAAIVSALVVVGLFQPTRRRLIRFVDQRLYHIGIDYQKTPVPMNVTSVLTQTRFGAYQNLELIGRGGMAEVYKATHPTLNQTVAVKLLPAALAADENFRKRFQREAQTIAALQHPNIVRLFDYGVENDTHYMVMEYLSGKDLDAHLHQQGRLTLDQAKPILDDIADALDYAHERGLVHRDIKPSNVMFTDPHPRAVLTDFGIAKIVGGHTVMTRTGGVLGTFDYIAPEQIQGSQEIDGRADVYSLGVMIYQMLTGELPFKHNNSGALLIAHLTQPPPDPRHLASELSSETVQAIQRAMAKKPEERFATAGEFARSLS